ncbi:hypothetical protein [Streptomyces sp. RFCAC02]|uniref:hypothetical protein n=1 Tax=Streptomyces sp. RFCAC02 TaxID=2499143 RepID=UPI001F1102F8|nr:hypothetical protein [Streptomyces sp. RFCAC02]
MGRTGFPARSAAPRPSGVGTAGLRVLRAAVFTALCVTLSAGAHILLSGTPLPAATAAPVAAAVFALALLLAGDRERGFWSIAALLVPLQLAADTVFTTGQATCYGPGGGPVTGPLRMLGLDLLCGGGDLGGSLSGLTSVPAGPLGGPLGGPLALLAAHIAVGLLAACWLRGGEAALASALRSAVAVTFRPLLLAVAAVHAGRSGRRTAAPRAGRREEPAPRSPLLAHSVLRRGPPAPAALAS